MGQPQDLYVRTSIMETHARRAIALCSFRFQKHILRNGTRIGTPQVVSIISVMLQSNGSPVQFISISCKYSTDGRDVFFAMKFTCSHDSVLDEWVSTTCDHVRNVIGTDRHARILDMFQSTPTSDGNGPTYFGDLFHVNCGDNYNMGGDGVEGMHCFQFKKNTARLEVRRERTVVRRWEISSTLPFCSENECNTS